MFIPHSIAMLADSHKKRYERKFVIEHLDLSRVEMLIRQNTAFFREVYRPRRVNNIYFDTHDLVSYEDNVAGIADRLKIRIRWYGETVRSVSDGFLELKIKQGLLGSKLVFPLKSFFIDDMTDGTRLCALLRDDQLPGWLRTKTQHLEPVLLNSYMRKYFLSHDGRYRITLDWNVSFQKPIGSTIALRTTRRTLKRAILELKYDAQHDTDAQEISTQFPFRLEKNSKYILGLEAFHEWNL